MAIQIPLWYGIGERDRILAVMSENHHVYVTALRSIAYKIAAKNGNVTIDDVRAAIAEQDFPMPSDIDADERIFGCVLSRCKDFVCQGQRLSSRPERVKSSGVGASYISVYTLAEKPCPGVGRASSSVPHSGDEARFYQSETTDAQTSAAS